jgi:hypothetical protein
MAVLKASSGMDRGSRTSRSEGMVPAQEPPPRLQATKAAARIRASGVLPPACSDACSDARSTAISFSVSSNCRFFTARRWRRAATAV